jgi:SAM-dependent methyltransferase
MIHDVSFAVDAASYDRFMGRYSLLLAPQLADFAGVAAGQRVLDVGSGPGALTAELVARVGATNVVAVDPSPPFVAALRERLPGVEAERASAEALPFADGGFDAALAQLVVHFMADPVAGLRELARVTRAGGVVAASVWDHAGERSPLTVFWRAARELDPGSRDESELAGAREGHLVELLRSAGLERIEVSEHEAPFEAASFEAWWEPFTLGVGPAGQYVARLDEEARIALRERCRELLPDAPRAVAWAARGVVA